MSLSPLPSGLQMESPPDTNPEQQGDMSQEGISAGVMDDAAAIEAEKPVEADAAQPAGPSEKSATEGERGQETTHGMKDSLCPPLLAPSATPSPAADTSAPKPQPQPLVASIGDTMTATRAASDVFPTPPTDTTNTTAPLYAPIGRTADPLPSASSKLPPLPEPSATSTGAFSLFGGGGSSLFSQPPPTASMASIGESASTSWGDHDSIQMLKSIWKGPLPSSDTNTIGTTAAAAAKAPGADVGGGLMPSSSSTLSTAVTGMSQAAPPTPTDANGRTPTGLRTPEGAVSSSTGASGASGVQRIGQGQPPPVGDGPTKIESGILKELLRLGKLAQSNPAMAEGLLVGKDDMTMLSVLAKALANGALTTEQLQEILIKPGAANEPKHVRTTAAGAAPAAVSGGVAPGDISTASHFALPQRATSHPSSDSSERPSTIQATSPSQPPPPPPAQTPPPLHHQQLGGHTPSSASTVARGIDAAGAAGAGAFPPSSEGTPQLNKSQQAMRDLLANEVRKTISINSEELPLPRLYTQPKAAPPVPNLLGAAAATRPQIPRPRPTEVPYAASLPVQQQLQSTGRPTVPLPPGVSAATLTATTLLLQRGPPSLLGAAPGVPKRPQPPPPQLPQLPHHSPQAPQPPRPRPPPLSTLQLPAYAGGGPGTPGQRVKPPGERPLTKIDPTIINRLVDVVRQALSEPVEIGRARLEQAVQQVGGVGVLASLLTMAVAQPGGPPGGAPARPRSPSVPADSHGANLASRLMTSLAALDSASASAPTPPPSSTKPPDFSPPTPTSTSGLMLPQPPPPPASDMLASLMAVGGAAGPPPMTPPSMQPDDWGYSRSRQPQPQSPHSMHLSDLTDINALNQKLLRQQAAAAAAAAAATSASASPPPPSPPPGFGPPPGFDEPNEMVGLSAGPLTLPAPVQGSALATSSSLNADAPPFTMPETSTSLPDVSKPPPVPEDAQPQGPDKQLIIDSLLDSIGAAEVGVGGASVSAEEGGESSVGDVAGEVASSVPVVERAPSPSAVPPYAFPPHPREASETAEAKIHSLFTESPKAAKSEPVKVPSPSASLPPPSPIPHYECDDASPKSISTVSDTNDGTVIVIVEHHRAVDVTVEGAVQTLNNVESFVFASAEVRPGDSVSTLMRAAASRPGVETQGPLVPVHPDGSPVTHPNITRCRDVGVVVERESSRHLLCFIKPRAKPPTGGSTEGKVTILVLKWDVDPEKRYEPDNKLVETEDFHSGSKISEVVRLVNDQYPRHMFMAVGLDGKALPKPGEKTVSVAEEKYSIAEENEEGEMEERTVYVLYVKSMKAHDPDKGPLRIAAPEAGLHRHVSGAQTLTEDRDGESSRSSRDAGNRSLTYPDLDSAWEEYSGRQHDHRDRDPEDYASFHKNSYRRDGTFQPVGSKRSGKSGRSRSKGGSSSRDDSFYDEGDYDGYGDYGDRAGMRSQWEYDTKTDQSGRKRNRRRDTLSDDRWGDPPEASSRSKGRQGSRPRQWDNDDTGGREKGEAGRTVRRNNNTDSLWMKKSSEEEMSSEGGGGPTTTSAGPRAAETSSGSGVGDDEGKKGASRGAKGAAASASAAAGSARERPWDRPAGSKWVAKSDGTPKATSPSSVADGGEADTSNTDA
ncbi:unnamed protein product [Vitrella brassicaformis CCMP3155]|uniref:Uncharacterized protein n=3 Tax=Vitrella brassicaformis TaxID=1169539 RepID=A0A0G4FQW2_VITBC|nr:unnamed protein product [Vitrella brassicaformis CCMP3155]|eukprot:CEM16846.1 unnamed protein product [Vitrella brassicaformis CCMP3155]